MNHAIPPPLEEVALPESSGRGGDGGGGRRKAGGGYGRSGTKKGLGWSASGAELRRFLGLPGDDSVSTYFSRSGWHSLFGTDSAIHLRLGFRCAYETQGIQCACVRRCRWRQCWWKRDPTRGSGGCCWCAIEFRQSWGCCPRGRRSSRCEPECDCRRGRRLGQSYVVFAFVLKRRTNNSFTDINALKEMTLLPLLYPEVFQRFNLVPPRGVLFMGHPVLVRRSLQERWPRAAEVMEKEYVRSII